MPRFPDVWSSVFRQLRKASTVRKSLCLMLLLMLHGSFLTNAHAQSATATLSGIVIDQTGAVIPGVKIAVISIAQGFQRNAMTSDEGIFIVSQLPPGSYTVKAEHDGFTPAEVRDVVLNVNDQKTIKVYLKVGNISQTVEIVDGSSLIDDSAAVGTVVDRRFVSNLPLNGRSFHSLITLTPSVVLTKASADNPGQFSINGQRGNANYFMVDGVGANIAVTRNINVSQTLGGSLPGLTAQGGTNSLVSVDALQEFKVLTSTYAPEFGRSPGGQISIITRSGTNDFHGTLFDYFRNDVFDANDWFANATRQPKPKERQNDFGGVLGGPVLLPRFGEGGRQPWYDGHNRTFFFASYERRQRDESGFFTSDVDQGLGSSVTVGAPILPFTQTFNGLTAAQATFANNLIASGNPQLIQAAVGYLYLASSGSNTALRVSTISTKWMREPASQSISRLEWCTAWKRQSQGMLW